MEKLRERLEQRKAIRDQVDHAIARWRAAIAALVSEVKSWLGELGSGSFLELSVDEDENGFSRLRISEPNGLCVVMECRDGGFVALHLEPSANGVPEFQLVHDPNGHLPEEWRIAVLEEIENAIVEELTPEEKEKATSSLYDENYIPPDDPLEFVDQREERVRSYARGKMNYEEIIRRAQPLSASLFESALLRLFR